MPSVAFVPTAGAKEDAYLRGRRLPVIFTWSIFKWAYRSLGIRAEHLSELKEETIVRLGKALELYQTGEVNKIFLSGGASKHYLSSADMMANWLVCRGVPVKVIIVNNDTLQTGDSAGAFTSYLWNEYPYRLIRVFIVTSWYHILRTKLEIEKSLRNEAVDFWTCPVFPPLTRECLGREYLYNLLTEPFKLLVSWSSQFKSWYRKRESRARGLE